MTEDQARAVWVILVEVCSASKDPFCEKCFVDAQVRELVTEWRFGGNLGFGGKFWRNMDKWYVSYYSEDMTPEREEIIAEANEKLRQLQTAEDDGPQAA